MVRSLGVYTLLVCTGVCCRLIVCMLMGGHIVVCTYVGGEKCYFGVLDELHIILCVTVFCEFGLHT